MSTRHLRSLVADTALRLGPEAPTLCHPWTVQDLMAHLVVREQRPDALPGIGMSSGPLTRHTATLQEQAAQCPLAELAEQVRSGPAAFMPTRLPVLDRLVNTAELAIHHEDMARAAEGWEPLATLTPAEVERLWSTYRTGARVLYRSAPTGIIAVAAGYGRVVAKRPGKNGRGTVVLRGTPLELLLHAFGRTEVARVEMDGTAADVVALRADTRAV